VVTGIASDEFRIFGDQMLYRVARQGVLAGNIANVDTPEYRRHDMKFADRLNAEVTRLERTDPNHLRPDVGTRDGQYRIERGPRGTRPDGNGVNMDQELVEVSRNASAFTNQATVLARIVGLYRAAIGSG
jgi:flagellar basal-body rod protein FlgB